MLIVLPIAAFVSLMLWFQSFSCWRRAALAAAVAWGVLVVVITELLSYFDLITYAWTGALWTLVCAGVGTAYVATKGRAAGRTAEDSARIQPMDRVFVFTVVMIVATLGVIAIVSPPNNWDSMSYHMSRVAHWVQNQSVSFYPTNIIRQDFSSPWAEFAILHFQVLSGGDRFANLVQGASLIGCIIGVSLIARQFGGGATAQVFAALMAATMPIAILQATSTQNDLVLSFWLVCFAYYSLCIVTGEDQESDVWLAGSSLGLAILTKATALVFVLPPVAWLAVAILRKQGYRSWKWLVTVGSVALALNAAHFSRNYLLFGNILAPGQSSVSSHVSADFSNEITTIASVLSNVTRELSLQIATPFHGVNRVIEKAVVWMHARLNIHASDPRTTWKDVEFHVYPLSNNEGYAGNPAHLVMILFALCLLALSWRRHSRLLLTYTACTIASFVLFCASLRWQLDHARLLVPVLLLSLPSAAVVLTKHLPRGIVNAVGAMLIILALPYVFLNNLRPVFGNGDILGRAFFTRNGIFTSDRTDLYFNHRPQIRESYEGAARFLKSRTCSQVGLVLRDTRWEMFDDWEYPFWVMLNDGEGRRFRLEHVMVQNASAKKQAERPFRDYVPCAAIVMGSSEFRYEGVAYTRLWSQDDVNVFVR